MKLAALLLLLPACIDAQLAQAAATLCPTPTPAQLDAELNACGLHCTPAAYEIALLCSYGRCTCADSNAVVVYGPQGQTIDVGSDYELKK